MPGEKEAYPFLNGYLSPKKRPIARPDRIRLFFTRNRTFRIHADPRLIEYKSRGISRYKTQTP